MPMLQVSSVVPALAADGCIIITAGRNASEKGKPRITRSIQIPEITLDASIPSKFVSLILSGLYSAARDQLAKFWEINEGIKEVASEAFTLDSILLFLSAEAESKRLSKATIGEFFTGSKLREKLIAKGATEKTLSVVLAKLSIAANPQDKGNMDENLKLITWLEDDLNAENFTASLLVNAFNRKTKELQELADSFNLDAIEL